MPASRIVLFGPPGIGKGTQAERLRDSLNLPHISTGDILRLNIRNNTALGQQAKSYMDAGKLVPDDLVVALVESRLAEVDCQDGFILDGFPRTAEQYNKLEAMLARRKMPVDAVLFFSAPDNVIIERISGRRVCKACGASFHVKFKPSLSGDAVCDKCGGELYQRSDDNETSVAERLRQYAAMSRPLIERYKSQGLLRDLPATGKPDEVFALALKALGV